MEVVEALRSVVRQYEDAAAKGSTSLVVKGPGSGGRSVISGPSVFVLVANVAFLFASTNVPVHACPLKRRTIGAHRELA
eukprot:1159088-Pelagomonas_calceolata.AAC.9